MVFEVWLQRTWDEKFRVCDIEPFSLLTTRVLDSEVSVNRDLFIFNFFVGLEFNIAIVRTSITFS